MNQKVLSENVYPIQQFALQDMGNWSSTWGLEILLPSTWRTSHIVDVTLFWNKLFDQERVYNHEQNPHVPFPQRSQTPFQGNIPRCVTVCITVVTVMSQVTGVKRPGYKALCLFSRIQSFFIHSVVLTEVLQCRKKIPCRILWVFYWDASFSDRQFFTKVNHEEIWMPIYTRAYKLEKEIVIKKWR